MTSTHLLVNLSFIHVSSDQVVIKINNPKWASFTNTNSMDPLLDEDSNAVADLQDSLDKTIEFQVEPVYSQEQFDVILL